MEQILCHVLFCDRRAETEVLLRRQGDPDHETLDEKVNSISAPPEVKDNLKTILAAFQEVYLCRSGMSCSARLRELEHWRHKGVPVVVFLDIDPNVDFGNRLSREVPRAQSGDYSTVDDGLQEYYGVTLLKHLTAQALQDGIVGELMVPIAVIRNGRTPPTQTLPNEFSLSLVNLCDSLKSNLRASSDLNFVNTPVLMKCLDAGATDAFNSPLTPDGLQQIIVAAYKAHLQHAKAKPNRLDLKSIRKRSWVGMEEDRPYAYLRESMVSSLMNSICRPETTALGVEASIDVFDITTERAEHIDQALRTWNFSAHDFSDDELLYAAFLMLSHCLRRSELEQWRQSSQAIKRFLLASRAAYNSFVPYHNFRHVVDVLQALFFSLVQIGALDYGHHGDTPVVKMPSSAASHILEPLDALILLVAAIGHDVGHPGVSNAFLVTLKAPLAQLYNDKSVLEAFHCAAYSQILRRHWKSIYEDVDFRRRLINTILATDMGLHSDYMASLGKLQDKLHDEKTANPWSPKLVQNSKDLLLGLLIKCADISNVARPFDIAGQWARILQREFARQGGMERDIGMSSTLFGGPPEIGNLVKLANSQIGFMNLFGLPLFEGVADIFPGMHFAVSEIVKNKITWEGQIEQEKCKEDKRAEWNQLPEEGARSPRSESPDRSHFMASPEASHPEGLPASTLSPGGRLSLLDGNEAFFTPPASPQTGSRGQVLVTSESQNMSVPQILHGGSGDYQTTDTSRPQSLSRKTDAQLHANTSAYGTNRQLSETQHVMDHTHASAVTSRTSSQNFSRPYSQQHSAQASCSATRSSASREPTLSSNQYPTSPTETHATSIGESSDLGSSIMRPDTLDRSFTGNSTSGIYDTVRQGLNRESRASVSVVSDSHTEKAHSGVRPVTSGTGMRPPRSVTASDKTTLPQIKRKSSRWKFDFWRRKKQAERDDQGIGSTSISAIDTS